MTYCSMNRGGTGDARWLRSVAVQSFRSSQGDRGYIQYESTSWEWNAWGLITRLRSWVESEYHPASRGRVVNRTLSWAHAKTALQHIFCSNDGWMNIHIYVYTMWVYFHPHADVGKIFGRPNQLGLRFYNIPIANALTLRKYMTLLIASRKLARCFVTTFWACCLSITI